jgi:folate-binding protein YgfZ
MFSPERYTAAHEGAVVLDRQTRGRIVLTGPDRLSYLQGLLTNDVAALNAGTGCYAALLTPQGRMISDMRVLELGDRVLLDVPHDVAPHVASHLIDFIFTEDVAVENVTASMSHLTVIGPASADALGVGSIPTNASRRVTTAGVAAIAVGNSDFGVPAIDLFVPSGSVATILAALNSAGVTSVDDDVGDALRIEAGTPMFGVDMTNDTIPLEAGIQDRAISLTKGCYVGQEVIIRVLHRGHGRVARKLVGLTFPADGQPPAPGEPLHSGERRIGTVTSATWSPAVGRPIALGYVHRDFAEPGTVVESGEGARQQGTVTALPFTSTGAR